LAFKPHPANPDHELAVKNSCAPSFMARTDMGMSPWPVMKMIELDVRITQFG
jgi:hypothetical protein